MFHPGLSIYSSWPHPSLTLFGYASVWRGPPFHTRSRIVWVRWGSCSICRIDWGLRTSRLSEFYRQHSPSVRPSRPFRFTAKCSANVDGTIYIKSSLIEVEPFSGNTATLKYILCDQKFGATIPDGTIIYVTNKLLTVTTFLESGNISCQARATLGLPAEFVGIAGFSGSSFRSFIYKTNQAKWVMMSKSNDCCIC